MSVKNDAHDALLFGGTGLGKVVRFITNIYYRDIAIAAGGAHVVSLAFAGLLHPVLRHRYAKRVRDRKAPVCTKPLFVIGHSQGAIEALWQALTAAIRGERPVTAVFCLSGPLDGAPLASIVAFLKRLPKGLRSIFAGILEMIHGSEQLEGLQALAVRACSAPRLPHIYLIAAACDGLVPIDSAWKFPAEYPQHLVHRCLLIASDEAIPDNLPEDVHLIRTSWGMDNHLTMIASRELQQFIREVIALSERGGQIQAEVDVVVGSV